MREELLEARGCAAVSIEGWSPTRRAAAGAREQSRLASAARSAPPVPNAGRRQRYSGRQTRGRANRQMSTASISEPCGPQSRRIIEKTGLYDIQAITQRPLCDLVVRVFGLVN